MNHSAKNGKRLSASDVRKELQRTEECTCCHVYHNPGICAQCQVAGCGGNKKGEKCRLSGHILSTMAMSEFQLRQRVIELEKQVAQYAEATQKLAGELESKRTAA